MQSSRSVVPETEIILENGFQYNNPSQMNNYRPGYRFLVTEMEGYNADIQLHGCPQRLHKTKYFINV